MVPADGASTVTTELGNAIKSALRTMLSPRHVPDTIVAVEAVPRTLFGKRVEVPVKRIMQGSEPDTVLARETLADPDAIDEFQAFAAKRRTT